MNIFVLDEDPVAAAQAHHDKHIVKMVLETAQILSTVVHGLEPGDPYIYRPTHANHPCVVWAGASRENFEWLVHLGIELGNEYSYRFRRVHKSLAVILMCGQHASKITARQRTEFAQAMPEQYRVAGNAVLGYRRYYLGEKIKQSRWTRRPVPSFVRETMTEQVSTSSETTTSADAPKVGTRGPKGVALDAKITVLASGNPKRDGSKAHSVFAKYHDGMTVGEFLEAAGSEATPNLVYDAGHGFIAIDGYTPTKVFVPKEKVVKPPKEVVAKEPKPKKEKVAKAAKPKKSSEAAPAEAAAPDMVVAEETID